ncbi:MAG: hypothetical protein ABIR06_06480 [Cyclobacteriaceae bacterium]
MYRFRRDPAAKVWFCIDFYQAQETLDEVHIANEKIGERKNHFPVWVCILSVMQQCMFFRESSDSVMLDSFKSKHLLDGSSGARTKIYSTGNKQFNWIDVNLQTI